MEKDNEKYTMADGIKECGELSYRVAKLSLIGTCLIVTATPLAYMQFVEDATAYSKSEANKLWKRFKK